MPETSTSDDFIAESQSGSSTRPTQLFRPTRAARKLLTTAIVLALTASPSLGMTPWKRETDSYEISTAEPENNEALNEAVEQVFREGSEELFFDGYSSAFASKLVKLLKEHGKDAVRSIVDHIFNGLSSSEVVSEALRWLSEFDDHSTLALRWYLLERTLQSPSPKIRNGAILGFANLDDPAAVSKLDMARKNEDVVELRRLIDKVIAQLTR